MKKYALYSHKVCSEDNKDAGIGTQDEKERIHKQQTSGFLSMPAHRMIMIFPPKFCTACGTPRAAGMRFCSQCGQPFDVVGTTSPLVQVSQQDPGVMAAPGRGTILGIVPFLEQGLLSVIHYTLIVTDRRLIFCTWDPDTDEAMSEAEDEMMQGSCSISETKDEIAHFRAKDWSTGPWLRYLSTAPDTVIAVHRAPSSSRFRISRMPLSSART